jgi:hypothetical protein
MLKGCSTDASRMLPGYLLPPALGMVTSVTMSRFLPPSTAAEKADTSS